MSSLLVAIDVCWSAPFTLYDAVFSRGSVSVLQLRERDNRELPYKCVCVVKSWQKSSWPPASRKLLSVSARMMTKFLCAHTVYIRCSIWDKDTTWQSSHLLCLKEESKVCDSSRVRPMKHKSFGGSQASCRLTTRYKCMKVDPSSCSSWANLLPLNTVKEVNHWKRSTGTTSTFVRTNVTTSSS